MTPAVHAWNACSQLEDGSSWSYGLAIVLLASSITRPLLMLGLFEQRVRLLLLCAQEATKTTRLIHVDRCAGKHVPWPRCSLPLRVVLLLPRASSHRRSRLAYHMAPILTEKPSLCPFSRDAGDMHHVTPLIPLPPPERSIHAPSRRKARQRGLARDDGNAGCTGSLPWG